MPPAGGSPEAGRPQGGAPSQSETYGTSRRAGVDIGEIDAALGVLADAVDRVAGLELDGLDDRGVERLLVGVQRQADRLIALRTEGAGMLETRALRRAGPGREQRALRDTREFVRRQLGLTPSQAKQAGQTGRRLAQAASTRDAAAHGRLNPDKTRVICDLLARLPASLHAEAERQLLTAADTQDAIELGRTARRLHARLDQPAAERSAAARQSRRYARVTQTTDGAVALSARLYGLAAEQAMVAIDAFRRPDPPDSTPRSPEQATADALAQAFSTALDAGKAPTRHGQRPHLTITTTLAELAQLAGSPELAATGPTTWAELRPILDDVSACRIVLDAHGVPLEVSRKVRTVPAGLYRYLTVRDRGCAWRNCDAPPGWCDVAHVGLPWWQGGRLGRTTAVLLCRTHHRLLDNTDWTATIDGDTVTFHPPPDSTDTDRATQTKPAAQADPEPRAPP